ncbi:MAG: sugar phosphate isomerase/epimerase family protein [Chloroflexota bacterium]
MTKKQLTVGAALRSSELAKHADWILEANRDLEIQDPVLPMLLDGNWKLQTKEINSILDGYGGRIGIHGPFINMPINAFDRKIREVVQLRIDQALDFAAEINGTHMVVHSPFDYFGGPFRPLSDRDWPLVATNSTLETLSPAVEKAKSIGLTIVIETIHDKNTLLLLDLVRAFDTETVRLSIDMGHVYINHHIAHGPSPDEWAAEAGDLLAHVHIQDTDGLSDRHWAPGKGNINFYPFFEEVRKLETTPRLILELKDKSMIPAGAVWLIENGHVDR